jgi:hypothetical protein
MDDDARRRVTVVLDRDIADAVERAAERERGSLSGVCRRVLSGRVGGGSGARSGGGVGGSRGEDSYWQQRP